jgi:hypothetical protein
VNVFWLQVAASSRNAADLRDVIDDMASSWRSQFGGKVKDAYISSFWRAQWFTGPSTAIVVGRPDVWVGSEDGSHALPASIAMMLLWEIESLYRGGKPRTSVSGLSEADMDSPPFWDSGIVTSWQTAAEAFLAAVNALTSGDISAVSLGTVRFFEDYTALAPPVFWPYTGVRTRPWCAHQRRRDQVTS